MSKRNDFGSQFEKIPKKDAAYSRDKSHKSNKGKSRQCVYINIDTVLSRHLKKHCKQAAKRNYRLRFLKKADAVARRGKLVYVREEYHERIQRIANSIGEGEVSLFSYLDNVLTEHFATHREVITALYNEHNRSIF